MTRASPAWPRLPRPTPVELPATSWPGSATRSSRSWRAHWTRSRSSATSAEAGLESARLELGGDPAGRVGRPCLAGPGIRPLILAERAREELRQLDGGDVSADQGAEPVVDGIRGI